MEINTKKKIDLVNQKIKELNSLYRAAASKAGISDGEVCIWSTLLNSDEEYSQQDLCDLLFLPKQTVNSIVSNLIKRGFVYLEHVPGTRNRKVIRLSEEGRAYGDEKVMWIFRAEQEAMEGTDPQEVQATISMLEKYIERLREKLEDTSHEQVPHRGLD